MIDNKDVIGNQLLSMRSAIDAMLAFLCPQEETQEQGCKHPLDKRKNHSSMGVNRWQCQDCGYLHEEKVSVDGS